jgi:hypothetical protein
VPVNQPIVQKLAKKAYHSSKPSISITQDRRTLLKDDPQMQIVMRATIQNNKRCIEKSMV